MAYPRRMRFWKIISANFQGPREYWNDILHPNHVNGIRHSFRALIRAIDFRG